MNDPHDVPPLLEITQQEKEPLKPWAVHLTCCGRDEGTVRFATWDEAHAFREAYTSGPGVHPHGYGAKSYESGHRRSGVITEDVGKPSPPQEKELDIEAARAAISTLRDFARQGGLSPVKRDPLVMILHRALDQRAALTARAEQAETSRSYADKDYNDTLVKLHKVEAQVDTLTQAKEAAEAALRVKEAENETLALDLFNLEIHANEVFRQAEDDLRLRKEAEAEVARLTAYVQQNEHEDLSRVDPTGESVDSRTAPASRGDVNDSFFDALAAWNRHDDPDGGECIELQFAAGGRVLVHTSKPLLFIEPERH